MKRFTPPLILICLLMLSSASYAQTYWGALYVDKSTGIAGGSYNYGSQKSAQNVAHKSCVDKHNKKGLSNDCKYVVAFSNTCAAIYWSPVNKKAAWGTDGISANRAKQAAYAECVRLGGKNCQLSLSFCTDRYL